jgi:hypothetical protein
MPDFHGVLPALITPFTEDSMPAGATGTLAGKLGTIAAAGGKRQATYNGHPLYLYAGDQKAGDTAGQGLDQFGAEWYVLSPSGDKIDRSSGSWYPSRKYVRLRGRRPEEPPQMRHAPIASASSARSFASCPAASRASRATTSR